MVSVTVGVSSGTGDQMQALTPIETAMRPHGDTGMDTPGRAPVALSQQPDPGEITIKDIDQTVRDSLQFLLQRVEFLQVMH